MHHVGLGVSLHVFYVVFNCILVASASTSTPHLQKWKSSLTQNLKHLNASLMIIYNETLKVGLPSRFANVGLVTRWSLILGCDV
jgi:hypothetical protein